MNIIIIKSGNAFPNAYAMTSRIPPHVGAEAGANNIHSPNADATKLVVNEKTPIFLLAGR